MLRRSSILGRDYAYRMATYAVQSCVCRTYQIVDVTNGSMRRIVGARDVWRTTPMRRDEEGERPQGKRDNRCNRNHERTNKKYLLLFLLAIIFFGQGNELLLLVLLSLAGHGCECISGGIGKGGLRLRYRRGSRSCEQVENWL